MEQSGFIILLVRTLLVLGTIYMFVALGVYANIRSFAAMRLRRISKRDLSEELIQNYLQTDQWAVEHGFHFVGFFRICMDDIGKQVTISLATWENPERSSFLAQVLVEPFALEKRFLDRKPVFEIETIYDHHIVLETSNQRGAMLFPGRPGFYLQAFHGKNLDEMWELHLESAQYLECYNNIHLVPYNPEFPWENAPIDEDSSDLATATEYIQNRGFRTINKYISSLLFAPLRWPYWYYYRRYFWVNKTIQKQIEMQRLVSPNELPTDYEKWVVPWSEHEF